MAPHELQAPRVIPGRTRAERLRLVDDWIEAQLMDVLPRDARVLDLGYGAHPQTTVELKSALHRHREDIGVVGAESDKDRVISAERMGLDIEFLHVGFAAPKSLPFHLVRAMNVLRGYPGPECLSAYRSWATWSEDGGYLIEGTSDAQGAIGGFIVFVKKGGC